MRVIAVCCENLFLHAARLGNIQKLLGNQSSVMTWNSLGCLQLRIQLTVSLNINLIQMIHRFQTAREHLFQSINVNMPCFGLIYEEPAGAVFGKWLHDRWCL
jgi:hypothetical protein